MSSDAAKNAYPEGSVNDVQEAREAYDRGVLDMSAYMAKAQVQDLAYGWEEGARTAFAAAGLDHLESVSSFLRDENPYRKAEPT